MAYGTVFDAAMAKPMFPGAPGYGGSVTVGQSVRAQQAAVAQSGRNARQAAALAQPAGTGYGSLVTRGQAIAQGQRRAPMVDGGPMRTGVRNPRTTRAPGARSPRRAAIKGVDTGPPMPGPGGAMTAAPRFKKRTMMGIGLGLGVAAGVAMNRRGEGASSGRQSMYKY